ncbi:MAG TPA: gamma-glutamyl-gamma-aminobutyrate hydrolase family protein [Nocardioides sp.]|nr:gamma-glutamyl-gamma-aminobutyrate hydrolase family protein [Nocardioides sp.]
MTARVLVVQHEADDPIHLMGTWMQGVEISVCHAYASDPVPASLESFDGLVMMGGAMGAHDDQKAPWLPASRELIRLAAAADVPTLGICLGHQLCAVALGGDIVVNPNGRQLGLLDVGWTAEAADDPLFGGLVGPRRAMHWNDDVVVRLPEGGRRLATASTGEVQAAHHAPSVWGIQWHPEVDPALVAVWAQEGSLAEAERERVIDEVTQARDDLVAAWQPLGERFGELVASRRKTRTNSV